MRPRDQAPDGIRLSHGDVREELRKLPAESVHCVVTSPPYYGLRRYEGVEPSVWEPEDKGGILTRTLKRLGLGDFASRLLEVIGREGFWPTQDWRICEHEWISAKYRLEDHGDDGSISGVDGVECNQRQTRLGDVESATCKRCGAWLGCYGLEPDPLLYVWHTVLVCREIWRVLRKDGTLWWNIGDSYAGSGKGVTGANSILSKRGERFYEQRQGFVGPINQTDRSGSLRQRVGSAHGESGHTSGVTPPEGWKTKDLLLIPARVAIALCDEGWWVRSEIVWTKKSCMPESVTDRPTSSHEKIWLFTKSERYYFDAEAVRQKQGDEPTWEEYAKHLGHDWANDSKDMAEGRGHFAAGIGQRRIKREAPALVHPAGRNLRNVWHLSAEPYRGAHFATYPTEIPRRAILAGTSEWGVCARCGAPWRRVTKTERTFESGSGKAGNLPNGKNGHLQGGGETLDVRRGPVPHSETLGWEPTCKCEPSGVPMVVPATVLDPFVGSGTTLEVCRELARRGIGIDASETYLKLAEARVNKKPPNMFGIQSDEQPYEQPGLFTETEAV